MKKLAMFTVMALVTTGASAQSIKVTSSLIDGDKVIQQFSGIGVSGETQSYSVWAHDMSFGFDEASGKQCAFKITASLQD